MIPKPTSGTITNFPNKIIAICKLFKKYVEISADEENPLLRLDPSMTQMRGETVLPKETSPANRLSVKTAPEPQKTYSFI